MRSSSSGSTTAPCRSRTRRQKSKSKKSAAFSMSVPRAQRATALVVVPGPLAGWPGQSASIEVHQRPDSRPGERAGKFWQRPRGAVRSRALAVDAH